MLICGDITVQAGSQVGAPAQLSRRVRRGAAPTVLPVQAPAAGRAAAAGVRARGAQRLSGRTEFGRRHAPGPACGGGGGGGLSGQRFDVPMQRLLGGKARSAHRLAVHFSLTTQQSRPLT